LKLGSNSTVPGGPDELEPCCQLPGGKKHQGETTSDTANRIISAKLASFQSALEFIGSQTDPPQWRQSKEHGVKTKYLRTVMCYRLKNGFQQIPSSQACAREPTPQATGKVDADMAVANVGSNDILVHTSCMELGGRNVSVIRDKEAKVYYAWLQPSEFDTMNSPGGEAELVEKLSLLKRGKGWLSV